MSLNLIDLLRQQVSAVVLEGESQDLVAKNHALSEFYPVFLSILKAKPELIAALQNNLNPRLTEVFQGHVAIQNQFLQQVSATTAQQAGIEQTLNRCIVPTLATLVEQAGSQDPTAIQHLLQQHSESIQQALPSWAVALIAALGINTASGENLNQLPPTQPEAERVQQTAKRPGWLIALLGVLIFAVLVALLLRACDERKPAVSTSTTEVVGTKPAMFQISMGHQGELVTCRIYSGDLQYIDILQAEVKRIFNHVNGCGAEHHSQYQQSFVNQDALPSVLKLLKGVPDTLVTWQGTQIFVQSANNTRAQAIASEIQRLTPNIQVKVASPQHDVLQTMQQTQQKNAAVYDSVARAEQALAQLDVNQLRPLDIATALNMQIINFDSGSAEIPELNKSVLTQAAVLIQRVPDVHVTIIGHTDAEGDAVMNKTLSQQRAQAVAEYFIHQGVERNKMTVQGYGEEQPIADNATEEGKFNNRRIEFKVENTDTGMVREIDASGVIPTKTP